MKKILIFALSLLIMVGSFSATTFAAAVDETTGKTNYAFGVTYGNITLSGYYDDKDGTRRNNLTDGEYTENSYCGTKDTWTNHTLIIDLGEDKCIDEVKLYHNTNGAKPSYTISLSTDGTNYDPVGTTGAYAKNCTSLSFTETKARYVKAFFSEQGPKTQLAEIEILGRTRTNVAKGATVTDKSGWYDDIKQMATDGSFKNYIGSSEQTTSLTIDLGGYYEVDEFAIYQTKTDGEAYSVYTGLTSSNTLSAVTQTKKSVNVDGTSCVKYGCDLPEGTITRYIRITTPDTVQRWAYEVVVYGKKVEAPTMGNITETADSEAGTTAVKLDVINGGENEITGRVYAAIYDDNDMLSAVYKAANTVTVANGAYTTVDNIVLNAASGNLKLFLWTDTLIPLCAAK